MTSKRMYFVMLGLIGLLVLGIVGSAFGATAIFEKKAATLHDLKLQAAVLSEEQVSLSKAKKDVAKYENLGKIAKAVVPQDKDQAQTVREIIQIGHLLGMRPNSITFPASTLGTKTAPGVATPTTGTTQTPSTKSLTQLTPVKELPGVYVLPITITQDSSNPVSYGNFLAFLSRLENNRRTAQVSGIVIQPSPGDPNFLSYTLTLDEYIKP